jgi:hypothetical protein
LSASTAHSSKEARSARIRTSLAAPPATTAFLRQSPGIISRHPPVFAEPDSTAALLSHPERHKPDPRKIRTSKRPGRKSLALFIVRRNFLREIGCSCMRKEDGFIGKKGKSCGGRNRDPIP